MYARHNVAHKNVAFGVTRAGSLVPVPVEPLDLGCKEKLRACRFCRKVKPGPGGGDQVPYLDGDATCPRESAGWQCVGSSSDGTALIAAAWHGDVWRSVDSGVTWSAWNTNSSDIVNRWRSVASSATGDQFVVVGDDGI